MWTRWFPWRWMVSRLARSQGFLDPMTVLSRLHRFAQPSEVTEPIELLRAGVIFHARGLINTRAIQHNLDWVWPYWVERQFDPHDDAFVPRAFSITHVNLTHRNWTALGLPDFDQYPIVDPRGLLTPLFDGWSLDAWIVPDEGSPLLPSRSERATQTLDLSDGLAVSTEVEAGGKRIHQEATVVMDGGTPLCRLAVTGTGAGPGWLVIAVRPVNPEGVSFIHQIEAEGDSSRLRVNGGTTVRVEPVAEKVCLSTYRRGDVLQALPGAPERTAVACDVGMATGALLYRLASAGPRTVQVSVPLAGAQRPPRRRGGVVAGHGGAGSWNRAVKGACTIEIPDPRMKHLFDVAVRNLVLHSPGEVYPGPFTYRRFWFRDAAYILNALLATGLSDRVRRAIDRFPQWQTKLGFFKSQDGEWDANGAALWIMDRYRRVCRDALPASLIPSVRKGAAWIRRKRLRDDLDAPHAGLLPAGFSAEHLGPNDYYYWDDFWSVAGLRSAAAILEAGGDDRSSEVFSQEADALMGAIDRSLDATAGDRLRGGVPASPYRRMDAGAIGSIACGYPLQLWAADEPRLLGTIAFLLRHCMVRNGFFQDVIHSGINPYLTLHMAQVLMRAGDARWWPLVAAVADLASPTGQWPEAIHPRTGGGCMGDGQHMWAAADWVMMMRNSFVLEETDRLVFGAGVPEAWRSSGAAMRLGPTPTVYGPVTVEVLPGGDQTHVRWVAAWHDAGPAIEVRVPGHAPVWIDGPAPSQGGVTVLAEEPEAVTEARW